MKKLFASSLAIAIASIGLGNVSFANECSGLTRCSEFDFSVTKVLPPPDLALRTAQQDKISFGDTPASESVKVLPPPDLALPNTQQDKINLGDTPASECIKVLPPPDLALPNTQQDKINLGDTHAFECVKVLPPPDMVTSISDTTKLAPVSKNGVEVFPPPDIPSNVNSASANLTSTKKAVDTLHTWTTRPVLASGSLLLPSPSSVKAATNVTTTTLFSKISKESVSKVFSLAAPIAMLTVDGLCGFNIVKALCADVAVSYLIGSIKTILP